MRERIEAATQRFVADLGAAIRAEVAASLIQPVPAAPRGELTIREAAIEIGVSHQTVRNWIAWGWLESRLFNGRRWITVANARRAKAAHT